MKLLIGVDGSVGSMAAVRFVGQMLSDHDEIFLYNSPPPVSVQSRKKMDPKILAKAQQAMADAVLKESKKQLPIALQNQVQCLIGSQKPTHGLLVAADEHRVDLIVVGARGVGPIESLLLGSVSRSIVHCSTVPVLVVRNAEKSSENGLNVLLCCDDSPLSDQAGKMLKKFTWSQSATGQIISVTESILAGHVPQWLAEEARKTESEAMAKTWIDQHDAELKDESDHLERYCQQLPAIFQESKPLVVEGHPAEEILKTIKQSSIDLAVVGARDLGPIQRWMLGSVSEHVLAHSGCSVLVVREHEKA